MVFGRWDPWREVFVRPAPQGILKKDAPARSPGALVEAVAVTGAWLLLPVTSCTGAPLALGQNWRYIRWPVVTGTGVKADAPAAAGFVALE